MGRANSPFRLGSSRDSLTAYAARQIYIRNRTYLRPVALPADIRLCAIFLPEYPEGSAGLIPITLILGSENESADGRSWIRFQPGETMVAQYKLTEAEPPRENTWKGRGTDQTSQGLGTEIREEGRWGREELRDALGAHQQALDGRLTNFGRLQVDQLRALRMEASEGRTALESALKRNTDAFSETQTGGSERRTQQ